MLVSSPLVVLLLVVVVVVVVGGCVDSWSWGSEERISFMASLALLSDLHARITVAPAITSCFAVSLPMPVLAPVIMTTLLVAVWSREGFGPVMYIFLVRNMRMKDATGIMMAGTISVCRGL